jgi:hypothetical protein
LSSPLNLQPKGTIQQDLGISFELLENQLGIIPGGRIIFEDFSIKITPRLLHSNEIIVVIVTNLTEREITVPARDLITMHVVNLKGNQELKIEKSKIVNKSSQTSNNIPIMNERTAQRFLSAKIEKFRICNIKGTVSQEKTVKQDLLLQAADSHFSATAFMLRAEGQVNSIYNLFAYENRAFALNVNKKTYFALFIKNCIE